MTQAGVNGEITCSAWGDALRAQYSNYQTGMQVTHGQTLLLEVHVRVSGGDRQVSAVSAA